MTPFHLGRKSSSINTMPKVFFLVLSLTVIYKTGSFPIPPTGNVLASASCLLDYCCMMFESTARPILEEVGRGQAEDPGHLPERRRSLLTMSSEGRFICKGSINIDVVQRPKDSQMLCRRLYDQHNSAWQTQCRLSTNRRPQEEEDTTLMTTPQEEAALQSRVRPFERKSRLISKLVSQRSTSTTAIDDYHHPWLVESSRRKIRQPEDNIKSVNGEGDSGNDPVANALAVYRLWRDANGYGKQKARWGRSSKTHSSWRRSSPADEQRKTTEQRRRNEATEEEEDSAHEGHEGLILSRSFSRADRRQVSNSTADKTRDWIVRDRPELDALMVPYLAAASRLFDAAPAAAAAAGGGGGGGAAAGGGVEEPNVNGNVLRRKRTRLDRSSRLSSSGDVFSSEAKYVLEGYLDWRSKNGYGKLAGRWG